MKCGVVVLVAVAAVARVASASPIRLVTSGDACRLDALEAQLTALVGVDPVQVDASATAQIEVERTGTGVRAAITFVDGDRAVRGPRVVTAASCDELVQAAALVIAMALPERVPRPPAAAPPAPVTVPPPPATVLPAPVTAPPPPATAQPETASTPAEPSRMASPTALVAAAAPSVHASRVAVFASGATGVTSRSGALQLIAGARVRRGPASLGAEVRIDAPQAVEVGLASIEVLRTQLTLAPCIHASELAACALAAAGTIRGGGDGLAAARTAYTPLLAAGLRLVWEHPLSPRIGLRVHADVDSLLTTTRFDVDHMQVWTTARFEAGTGLGVVAHFP